MITLLQKVAFYRASGALKRELVYRRNYSSHAEARQDIFEYIEVWYNRRRKHSAIGYMSPVEYEQQWRKSISIAA